MMLPKLNLVTPPAIEPFTVQELTDLDYLRGIDPQIEAALFTGVYISSARIEAEKWTNRKLLTQTWKATFDCLPGEYSFPFGQLQSVTSVKVYQEGGAFDVQDPSLYEYTMGDGAELWLKSGSTWATTSRRKSLFEIQFAVGWVIPGDIPKDIMQGMLAVMANSYYNREVVTGEVVAKFAHHRILVI